MARGGCVACWVCLYLLRTGEILTLRADHVTLSVNSRVSILALPDSRSAKLKNAGESPVISDLTARALLAFLCRGCSPQDWCFGFPLENCRPLSSQQQLPLDSSLQTYCLLTPAERCYFHYARNVCDAAVLSLPFEGHHPAVYCAALVSHLTRAILCDVRKKWLIRESISTAAYGFQDRVRDSHSHCVMVSITALLSFKCLLGLLRSHSRLKHQRFLCQYRRLPRCRALLSLCS